MQTDIFNETVYKFHQYTKAVSQDFWPVIHTKEIASEICFKH